MARKKDKKMSDEKSKIVTLVDDLYKINTHEISDAQEIENELNIDQDLDGFEIEEEKVDEGLDADAVEQSAEPTTEENTEAEGAVSDVAADDTAGKDEDSSGSDYTESRSAESDGNSESIEDQFNKLAKAIEDQAKIEVTEIIEYQHDPEVELAAQIAEDKALEEEIRRDQLKAEAAAEPVILGQQLDLEEIQSCIESLLFISDRPMPLNRLHELLGPHFERSLFEQALAAMAERYQSVHHGIELTEVSGGYQLRTKIGRSSLAQKLVKVQTQRLSGGMMESLAIIAYKQPVMKEEIDKIRGVDSSYFIRGLMDKKLINISGRSELPGRPMLYSTTQEFLEIFGLKDLTSLPSLRELGQMIPASETKNPEDEDPRVKEMRRLVNEMKSDHSSLINYDPKEDEKILKDIRERVHSIPSSTPYLEELRAQELLAKQQQQQLAAGGTPDGSLGAASTPNAAGAQGEQVVQLQSPPSENGQ